MRKMRAKVIRRKKIISEMTLISGEDHLNAGSTRGMERKEPNYDRLRMELGGY